MTISDPIADMLTRVRNAIMAKHDFVLVPTSRMKALPYRWGVGAGQPLPTTWSRNRTSGFVGLFSPAAAAASVALAAWVAAAATKARRGIRRWVDRVVMLGVPVTA